MARAIWVETPVSLLRTMLVSSGGFHTRMSVTAWTTSSEAARPVTNTAVSPLRRVPLWTHCTAAMGVDRRVAAACWSVPSLSQS